MLKIAFAAGLLLSPAMVLAQPPEQMGNGMGTEADAAAHSNTVTTSGHGSTMHRSGTGATTHHMHHGAHHTTRGASLSNNTPTTPNTSNSVSGPLNPDPH